MGPCPAHAERVPPCGFPFLELHGVRELGPDSGEGEMPFPSLGLCRGWVWPSGARSVPRGWGGKGPLGPDTAGSQGLLHICVSHARCGSAGALHAGAVSWHRHDGCDLRAAAP